MTDTLFFTILYLIIFLFGIVIGSFLNVCIFRIPKGESIAKKRSHCMSCGYQLAWYDLIPLFSWIMLCGKCRKCKAPISPQYPIIEASNGLLYVLIFLIHGFSLESVLYCLAVSALLALSVIDFRTFEIPFGFVVFIGVLGVIHMALDFENWLSYLIGLIAVSVPLLIILLVSKGRAIGGGDVKLMAACGLLLGWELILPAFIVGCILGSVIHIIRIRVSGEGHVLAMGPYLSAGVFLSMLFGTALVNWYISLF